MREGRVFRGGRRNRSKTFDQVEMGLVTGRGVHHGSPMVYISSAVLHFLFVFFLLGHHRLFVVSKKG